MLWLLHGEITSKTRPVPVVISKGTRSIRFDSLKQCAVFLDEVTHLTFGGVWYHLVRDINPLLIGAFITANRIEPLKISQ